MKTINSLLLKISITCMLLIASIGSKAAMSYSLTTLSESYTDLVGATVISSDTWGSTSQITETAIGFSFPYFSKQFTTFTMDGGGQLGLAEGGTGGGTHFIYPFSTIDLESAGIGLSPISYKLTGNVGNRILKIEWKNALLKYSTQTINMQAWLYENGTLEFHYGTNDVLMFYIQSTGIGLRGLVANTTEQLFVSGTSSAPVLSTSYAYLTSTIASGTVYRFTNITTAINNITANPIRLYPNPTTGLLTVSGRTASRIDVFNLSGEKVAGTSAQNTINLSTQAHGTYFLRVQVGNDVYTEKVVKK